MNYIEEIKAKYDYPTIIRDNKKIINEITNFLSKKMILSDQDYNYCVILIRTFEDNLMDLLEIKEPSNINIVNTDNISKTIEEKEKALRTIKYLLNYLMNERIWEYVKDGKLDEAQWEQTYNRIFSKLEVFRA